MREWNISSGMRSTQEYTEMNETVNSVLADSVGTASHRMQRGGTAPMAERKVFSFAQGQNIRLTGHESPLGSRLSAERRV
jgi:hypothetical protein